MLDYKLTTIIFITISFKNTLRIQRFQLSETKITRPGSTSSCVFGLELSISKLVTF